MADVQVTIRLRRKSGMNLRIFFLRDMRDYDVAYEIARRRRLFGSSRGGCLVSIVIKCARENNRLKD